MRMARSIASRHRFCASAREYCRFFSAMTISSAKQKSPAQTFHPRGARANYEFLENCCRLQNDRHHRTENQSQGHHNRHDKRSSLLGFLSIPHHCTSFREKSSRREQIPAAYTKSLYILHCIQFARMCNCQATNTKIFSHRACRLPFCSPLATYRAAVAKFPARRLSQTASSRTETRRTPSCAIRPCILMYFFVSFCCFYYCNSTSVPV